MTETLYDRRRIRLLTVIDEGNREGLEIAMGVSLPSRRVTRVLSELVALHGCPSALAHDGDHRDLPRLRRVGTKAAPDAAEALARRLPALVSRIVSRT